MSLTSVSLCAVGTLTRAAPLQCVRGAVVLHLPLFVWVYPIGVCLGEGAGDPVSLKVASVRNPETFI